MKYALILISYLIISPSFSATAIDGLYMSLFGGYAYLPGNVNNFHNGLTRTEAVYEGGFDAGGSWGFKGNHLRYEGELSYVQAKVDHFDINYVKQKHSTGYSDAIFAMANVYYDFCEIIPSFEPYLGVGIGYARVEAKLNNPILPPDTRWSGASSVFAYQGMAGLVYNFMENYALSFGYRYAATEKAAKLGKHFQAHMANIGAVYRFDGGRYI